VDQFSFAERDGTLNVVVRDLAGGDAMWGPEVALGSMALVRIPVGAFSAAGPTVIPGAYRALPAPPSAWGFHNRFVGDYLLYGESGRHGLFGRRRDGTLYVTSVHGDGPVATFELPHGVDRLEALGRHAVVVGQGTAGVHVTSVALDGRWPWVVDSFVQRGARQGEERSHAFFFRQDSERSGVVGLPVRHEPSPFAALHRGSAAVLFLDVEGLRFTQLGALASSHDRVDDRCRVSCVDWYGNARPIFYRGRVFALLGYEVVEGRIVGEAIHEVGRAHLIRGSQVPSSTK
jgi:hypothetical protein